MTEKLPKLDSKRTCWSCAHRSVCECHRALARVQAESLWVTRGSRATDRRPWGQYDAERTMHAALAHACQLFTPDEEADD